MVRMHCNREVIRLPDDGTLIRRMCTVCNKTFEQRKRVYGPRVGTLPDRAHQITLIDLNTGEPVLI